MDAEEKLTALKNAYADIILGISKDAAARVMASEKKSLRYQQELKATKEESVRMLMRLKHMMDTQNSEAEAAALNQQKKNEELEAQLHEAEDIVSELRGELAEMQTELEMMKSENSSHMLKPTNGCLVGITVEDKVASYQSYLPPNKFVPQAQRNECPRCYTKLVCTCGAYIRNPELPSIILKRKDRGLYRNGCTQRIRACENHLDLDLRLSEETNKVTHSTEQMEGRHSSQASAYRDKVLSELEQKLLADIDISSFSFFPQKRKRATRQRKPIKPLEGKNISPQKPNQLHAHSETRHQIPVNVDAHCAGNPSKVGSRSSQDEAELLSRQGCIDATEDDSNIDGRGNENVVGLIAGSSESLPTGSKMDVGKADVSSHSLESNSFDTTKGTSRPVREKVFKYTFQRKRKRQALVVSEVNGSSEMEKKIGDEQNGELKEQQSAPSPACSSRSYHETVGD